ncbi:MAG: AAA family ATPase [Candidatus Scatovivens sp.]
MQIDEKIKELKKIPKSTLKIMKLYLTNNLFEIKKINSDGNENTIDYRAIKTCIPENYNYLTYILNCKLSINVEESKTNNKIDIDNPLKICIDCKMKECIKYTMAKFLYELENINKNLDEKLDPVDIINKLLEEDETQYTEICNKDLFKNIDTYILLHISVLIKNELVQIINYDSQTEEAEFKYLDLTQLDDYRYYINKINEYYCNKKFNTIKLNMKDFKLEAGKEKVNDYQYFYKLAAYFIYMMKIKNIDVNTPLEEYLDVKNKEVLRNRAKYFIQLYNNRVNDLPCNKKTKDKIKGIFNYILNYNFDKSVPYIPINIVMYTEDTEIVNRITKIIGEYMWFFGYLNDNMKYYYKSMNEIIMNKNELNRMYIEEVNGKITNKIGMLTINNFENVIFANQTDKNMILNLLTEKIENNNFRVCNVIYGEKETIKSILSQYKKLNTTLFNLELDIDELTIEEVYNMLINKIELREKLSEEIKEKIHNYIKLTYNNSDVKNTEYVKVLYNKIMLKTFDEYIMNQSKLLSLDSVPSAYNTRDLPAILSDLNELIGLEKIKKQINNLISLLKFNKSANIDITKFNLHMIFTGSPGTGKTTVARLLSDILYNLGYIKRNKLVEVSAKDLIAEYVGQTSGKTYNVMKSAFGGVLFIDEAYSIIQDNSSNSFAGDCISTILKVMEDQKENIIVIFAGYENEMKNFIKYNPGLESRIGYNIKFEDYTIEELVKIFEQLLEKNNFTITKEALEKVKSVILKASKVKNFGNARYINKIYQDILIAHARNCEDEIDKDILMVITEKDINEDDLLVKDDTKRIGF